MKEFLLCLIVCLLVLLCAIGSKIEDHVWEIRNIEVQNYNDRVARENPR